MPRLVFNFTRKGQADSDPVKEDLIGLMSCQSRVANFLDIANSPALASGTAKRKRKAFTRSYIAADGSRKNKEVAEGTVNYTPSASAKAQKVTLTTGGKALKSPITITVNFTSGMTVSQIGEALAEIIPDTKIQRGATKPTPTEIYPTFKLKGGRSYNIPLKAAAEASTDVNVPDTEAAAKTAIEAADTKQKPSSSPSPSP